MIKPMNWLRKPWNYKTRNTTGKKRVMILKEHIKIDASVASHKGNIHSKNEEKFYLNGQYMDLHQQKDSTSKSATHSYKQSVYGIASGTVRGELGEQSAFIVIEALSRYHLYLEENGPTSFAVKKQRLVEHLESATQKIKELFRKDEIDGLGATMVGLIIDENRVFGFSIGEEGFYMVEEDAVRRVPMNNVQNHHYIGSDEPIEKILRVTDEFILDQEDRLLLTSKETYQHAMEGRILSLTKTLTPKESTKAYIKEMLTKEGQKNLTALLIYVEKLEGYATNNHVKAFPTGTVAFDSEEEPPVIDNENFKVSESDQDIEVDDDIDPGYPSGEAQFTSSLKQEHQDNFKEKGEGNVTEDPERERIFEQRYAESRMLFNKKLQRNDFEFSSTKNPSKERHESLIMEDIENEKSFEGDSGRDADLVGSRFDEHDEEFYEENPEGEESPWRTRSKFLLIALLAVGVIVMAFAFGTIRNLEYRIFNSSPVSVNGEDDDGVAGEDSTNEEAGDGEESGEEAALDDEEDIGEEDPSNEDENTEDTEEPDNDTEEAVVEGPVEEEASEPVGEETYEIQSGDTLFSISRAFYGDGSMVDEIIRLNNIEDINNIQVGDVLRLPPQD